MGISALPNSTGDQDAAVRSLTADSAGGSAIQEPEIGRQIRELRRIKRFTLQQLADSIGVSVSYLSQVERSRTALPIGTLKRICDSLGVHISWFFPAVPLGAGPERDFIVRSQNRRRMSYSGIGISDELLSPNLSGPLELLMCTIDPGTDSGEYSHHGSEAGLVIAGSMELWIDGTAFLLSEGDSFSFESSRPHRYRNGGDVPTKVLWVITPPQF